MDLMGPSVDNSRDRARSLLPSHRPIPWIWSPGRETDAFEHQSWLMTSPRPFELPAENWINRTWMNWWIFIQLISWYIKNKYYITMYLSFLTDYTDTSESTSDWIAFLFDVKYEKKIHERFESVTIIYLNWSLHSF